MFLVKIGVLAENLAILQCKICPKPRKLQVQFWEAKNDFFEKLKKTMCLEIWFYKGKMLSRPFFLILIMSLYPTDHV